MKAKKYILSLATVYMAYFTHGMQAIILSQNKTNFFAQWGYSDATAGAAAVSLAITACGFGKFLSPYLGGRLSDRLGRKVMTLGGGILYIISFAVMLFSHSFSLVCVVSFLQGVATSGFWDTSLYPVAQESVKNRYSNAALIFIKFFVSFSGVIYPLIAVWNSDAGRWQINIWIPLVFSVVIVIFAVIAPFAYDDERKINVGDGENAGNAADAELEAAKARLRSKPSALVQFFTYFYGFLIMFIMYGGQQYTKAFGMTNCGLTEMQSAALTSVYTFGSIAAVIFWGVMMARLQWNPVKVILIDSIATTVALILTLTVHVPAVIYVSILMLGFFAAGGALQTGISVRQQFCPAPRGGTMGIYATFVGFASVILPFVVSRMTTAMGEEKAVITMMVMLLGVAVLTVIMMLYLVGQFKKLFGYSPLGKCPDK